MSASLQESRVVVTARVEREARDELERRATESDRTISWLVRQAVDRYLRDEEGEQHG